MSITVRKAKRSDLNNLLKWGKDLHQVESEYEPLLKYLENESKEHYSSQLNNPRSLFLVAYLGDEPVGYLYAHIESSSKYLKGKGENCELEAIYIDPGVRGKDVAGSLVDECVEWARDRGIKNVNAGVYAGNKTSLKLLRKKGFRDYHIKLQLPR